MDEYKTDFTKDDASDDLLNDADLKRVCKAAEKAFVRVEKDGTHVSNLDLRRPSVWSTPEVQIQSVSQSVKKTGLFCVASHAIKHPASAVSKIIVSGGATRAIERPKTAVGKIIVSGGATRAIERPEMTVSKIIVSGGATRAIVTLSMEFAVLKESLLCRPTPCNAGLKILGNIITMA